MSDAQITDGASVVAMLLPVETGAAPLGVGVGGAVGRIQERLPRILEALRTYVAGFKPAQRPIDPQPQGLPPLDTGAGEDLAGWFASSQPLGRA